MRVRTEDNTMLTAEQIELMKAEYPPDMIDVEMNAQFPLHGLSMFPMQHLNACINPNLNDDMDVATHPPTGNPKKGWVYEEWPRVGIVHYEVPAKMGHTYIMAGDPGVDSPPKRNSPAIMVFDITTRPFTMVYFDWPSGGGSYRPFLQSFKYAMRKYAPVLKGMDATGPQKALDELGFEQFDLVIDALTFAGLKDTMLNSLLMAVTGHDLNMPRIRGLNNQMSFYRREMDKPTSKIEQDLVMTLAMVAYLARFYKVDGVREPNKGKGKANRFKRGGTKRTNSRRRKRA